MTHPAESSSAVASLRGFSALAAVAAALTGMLALMGWALNVAALKSVVPGLVTMKPNTASGFILSGAALWLLRRERAGGYGKPGLAAARFLAFTVATLGLLTLSQYLFGRDLGIDQLLFRDAVQDPNTSTPGRMAPATAVSFVLVGLALLLLDAPRGALAQFPAGAAGLVSLIAIIGYAYDVSALYRFGPYTTVAIHTASAFVVLSAGLLAARPERGFMALVTSRQPGGVLARRMLLPAVVIPLVVGWFRLQGERMGLFETEFGLALFATSNIALFVALIAWTASSLNKADAERAEAEQRVRDNEVRIRESEEQASLALEANRLKSEFLANMSHELRTPLNAIIGFSELMQDGGAGTVTPQQEEYLGDVVKSSCYLLQLINDVLDLARIEAGKVTFRPEPVDIATAVREAQDLRALAERKRIRFEAEEDPTIGLVMLDPHRLRQVLFNYLSNALKFTPDEGRVTVRVRAEGAQYFRLAVEDTGLGIRPEELELLFTEFQQLEAGAERRHTGTGLGLALTKKLVEAQGGWVGAESTPGRGSVFFAVLPRAAAPS